MPYKFNIVNLMKNDSLYNQGQKPLLYSMKRNELEGRTFYRDGAKICYFQNNLRKKSGGNFNTLTMTLTFQCRSVSPQTTATACTSCTPTRTPTRS